MHRKRVPPFSPSLNSFALEGPVPFPCSQASRIVNLFKAPVPSLPLMYHFLSDFRSVRYASGSEIKAIV